MKYVRSNAITASLCLLAAGCAYANEVTSEKGTYFVPNPPKDLSNDFLLDALKDEHLFNAVKEMDLDLKYNPSNGINLIWGNPTDYLTCVPSKTVFVADPIIDIIIAEEDTLLGMNASTPISEIKEGIARLIVALRALNNPVSYMHPEFRNYKLNDINLTMKEFWSSNIREESIDKKSFVSSNSIIDIDDYNWNFGFNKDDLLQYATEVRQAVCDVATSNDSESYGLNADILLSDLKDTYRVQVQGVINLLDFIFNNGGLPETTEDDAEEVPKSNKLSNDELPELEQKPSETYYYKPISGHYMDTTTSIKSQPTVKTTITRVDFDNDSYRVYARNVPEFQPGSSNSIANGGVPNMNTGMNTGMGTGMGTGMNTGMGTSMNTGMNTGMGTGMDTGMGTSMNTSGESVDSVAGTNPSTLGLSSQPSATGIVHAASETGLPDTIPGASQPQAAVAQPQAAVAQPQAAVAQPQAAVAQPQAAVAQPQAAVAQPQAANTAAAAPAAELVPATKDESETEEKQSDGTVVIPSSGTGSSKKGMLDPQPETDDEKDAALSVKSSFTITIASVIAVCAYLLN